LQQQCKQLQRRHRCATHAAVDASKLLVLPSTPQEYFPAAVGLGFVNSTSMKTFKLACTLNCMTLATNVEAMQLGYS
jgi:hypothetical protein